ncbi:DUF520 family protein, partial [Bacillus thuringiensis]|nr:DUF520 family protein [Bacillus thuringiensis]
MAKDSSFDIVSKVELPEVTNAINIALKEIQNRYDFKGSKSDIKERFNMSKAAFKRALGKLMKEEKV